MNKKSYGNHGEIFCAVLFDKFILPSIRDHKKVFKFLRKNLILESRYEKKTQTGGMQVTDIWFELTFKDDNNELYVGNIFIEAKTYTSTNSEDSLKESASKMSDELDGHVQRFFMNTIGSSYCVFRPYESGLQQQSQKRLNTLCTRNIFPESWFEICDNILGISKKSLTLMFENFVSIPNICTIKDNIKGRGNICNDITIVGYIEAIIKGEIMKGNIIIEQIVERVSNGINMQIVAFCEHPSRYIEIIQHQITQEENILTFPNNTEEGFEYISGSSDIYKKDVQKAIHQHRSYRIRRETLLDQPLLCKDIDEVEKSIQHSQEEIYELVNLYLKDKSLHTSVQLAINGTITAMSHRIKQYIISDSLLQGGLFFDWGANNNHKLKYDNSFLLESNI